MRERQSGRIINISSIGGKISVPHMLPYSASKFALVGLSEGLRAELAKDGIAVTTVTPGLMRTGSPLQASFKGQHEKEFTWFTISDSLPIASISAERAAREIVAACKRGAAELTLTLPARLVIPFHGVFPGLTADLLGVMNRLLPAPGGIGTEVARGTESQTEIGRKWSAVSYAAARKNNELAA
jgi:short-subunit dehydrogenase